jgi:hypothetical protein
VGTAELAAGLALLAWGLRRRSGGWLTAGAVLIAHGLTSPAGPRLRPSARPAALRAMTR